jgi:hypothetical protein
MCGVRTFPPVLRQIPDNGALDVDPTEIEFLSQWIAHSGARVRLRSTCPRKTNADNPFVWEVRRLQSSSTRSPL